MIFPKRTGGKNNASPEDCGGIYDYTELLETWEEPEHQDAEFMEYYPDFNSAYFDKRRNKRTAKKRQLRMLGMG